MIGSSAESSDEHMARFAVPTGPLRDQIGTAARRLPCEHRIYCPLDLILARLLLGFGELLEAVAWNHVAREAAHDTRCSAEPPQIGAADVSANVDAKSTHLV